MKKTFTRIVALLFAVVIFAGAPIAAHAETSYTYTYDYWEEYQECPDAYSVCTVITSSDLGLEVKMRTPQSLTVHDGIIYVCDTGNNRIIELSRPSRETLKVERIIDTIGGDIEVNTFASPMDLAVSEQGNIFICDQGNQRILKLDKDYNYICEFTKPIEATLDKDLIFQPAKLVVDAAERVYCVANGINKGLVKYESDTTFSGFVGATPVAYELWDYIMKKLASQEQRAMMENFVPTEYSNIFQDADGFLYVTACNFEQNDLDQDKIQAVRKLNLLGSDILVRNGDYPNFGDMYWGKDGPSRFIDVTVFDNDIYVCLDKNRGRLFAYDDQGRLIYAFGGNGNSDGYFRFPIAIEHDDYDLFVLDQLDCAITVFIPTDFGQSIFDAVDQFDAGEYEASGESWQKVMDEDGNFALAYIGIGRSLLRQKEYKEAMRYFKVKYDADNYSKAFKQYRKIWVQDNIGIIGIVILLLFLVPLGIGRIKKIKWEIDTADIFRR